MKDKSLGWTVAAFIPKSELTSKINHARNMILSISLLAFTLAFIIGTIISKSITRPIVKLERILNKIINEIKENISDLFNKIEYTTSLDSATSENVIITREAFENIDNSIDRLEKSIENEK